VKKLPFPASQSNFTKKKGGLRSIFVEGFGLVIMRKKEKSTCWAVSIASFDD